MTRSSKQFRSYIIFLALLVVGLMSSCDQQKKGGVEDTEPVGDIIQETDKELIYEVPLNGMNEKANGDRTVSGMAKFVVYNGTLDITIQAEGLEPNTMHLQHLHGLEELGIANCPDGLEADKNQDGFVDLIETRESAGITMIPLHDNPSSLTIKTETYPVSDENGKMSYKKTVDLAELGAAYNKKFGKDTLNLNKHIIFLHGVSSDAELPESVQSLPEVPAHVTLPVACGSLDDAEV
ncbi:hypothetical protein [Halocola ammonii]